MIASSPKTLFPICVLRVFVIVSLWSCSPAEQSNASERGDDISQVPSDRSSVLVRGTFAGAHDLGFSSGLVQLRLEMGSPGAKFAWRRVRVTTHLLGGVVEYEELTLTMPEREVRISNQGTASTGLLVNARLYEFDVRHECLVLDASGEVRIAPGGDYERSTMFDDLLQEPSRATD